MDTKLLSEPQDGKELTGPLTGIYSYHFKVGRIQYRIAYLIEKNDFILKILMIAKRESF
jgi:mRNA-degrading endonuclease RelE of RelBE toxin-antitoxin system